MSREEQIKKAWESAFKNVVESIDTERTKDDVACMFFELGCRWSDENKLVDWQQVRIQAAIAALQGLLSNEGMVRTLDAVCRSSDEVQERAARVSIKYADALVKELKGDRHE